MFLDSGKCFGFCEVFFDSVRCFVLTSHRTYHLKCDHSVVLMTGTSGPH